jgi:hypothetical protein
MFPGIKGLLWQGRPPYKIHTEAAPEWRNWQTRQVEGLVAFTGSAGSSPVSGSKKDDLDGCTSSVVWESCLMTMDELRRQLATTHWPIILRVDGKDIPVRSPEELMVPPAGNLICVYEDGAFEVIDSRHIATLHRTKAGRRQVT